jgi:hypothetical protein
MHACMHACLVQRDCGSSSQDSQLVAAQQQELLQYPIYIFYWSMLQSCRLPHHLAPSGAIAALFTACTDMQTHDPCDRPVAPDCGYTRSERRSALLCGQHRRRWWWWWRRHTQRSFSIVCRLAEHQSYVHDAPSFVVALQCRHHSLEFLWCEAAAQKPHAAVAAAAAAAAA